MTHWRPARNNPPITPFMLSFAFVVANVLSVAACFDRRGRLEAKLNFGLNESVCLARFHFLALKLELRHNRINCLQKKLSEGVTQF